MEARTRHRTARASGGRGDGPPTPGFREIIMGAQDNLTNVLAVVLGVAFGSGRVETVALAGVAAGLAEAISMGGVLYTSTEAEAGMRERRAGRPARLSPAARRGAMKAGLVTFAAAAVAAAIPLLPFAMLPLRAAMATSAVVSASALYALGAWKGRITGRGWWRDGVQVVLIGGVAAVAAALVGALFRTDGV